MLVLHYYEGPVLSDELRQMAEAVRKTTAEDKSRMEYHFRDESTFSVVERCDAIVSDKDHIVEAYMAVDVDLYESSGPEKTKRKRRTKEEMAAARAETSPEPAPESNDHPEGNELTDQPVDSQPATDAGES